MGFLSSILGTSNNFRATAPVNQFQATAPTLSETDYADAIRRAQDIATAQNAAAGATGQQQGDFMGQLLASAQGQGPSVAQQQLGQTTDENTRRIASAIASQRGVNPALAARMAATGTAGVQQQAAGQGAVQRAQEQLNAQNLYTQALQAKRAQDIAQAQAAGSYFGTAGGLQAQQNQNRTGAQLGTEQINAGTAAQNANLALGAQQINAGVTGQNAANNAAIVGGLLGGGGAAAQKFFAKGGVVPNGNQFLQYMMQQSAPMPVEIDPDFTRQLIIQGYGGRHKPPGYAAGGPIGLEATSVPGAAVPNYVDPRATAALTAGLTSAGGGVGAGLKRAMDPGGDPNAVPFSPMPAPLPVGAASPYAAPFPGVAPLLGPASPPSPLLQVSPAMHSGGIMDYRSGGRVAGKARVPGDSARNDTVPAMVSPGEGVIPRSIMQDDQAPEKAAAFVDAIKKKKGEKGGYGRVLMAQRSLADRISRLEKMAEGGEVGEAGSGGQGIDKDEKGKDKDHARGWTTADKIQAMLPAWLSGRAGALAQRQRQDDAYAASRSE